MGTPLDPKYIPYTYMEPLGRMLPHAVSDFTVSSWYFIGCILGLIMLGCGKIEWKLLLRV